MAKISWNDVGQRFYEAGTDRGVLYVDGINGVPWNGLIGVSENISGGEPRPFYLDGYKYLNLASVEEYAATIRGFSSPREFEQCDGAAALHNGLFATQQPRKSFGFSYRTLIGNDVDGLALGYKLHLVYNALAAPAQRSYSTNSDTPSPVSFDWSISTLPPKVTGIKPTAHFVIDSRLTPPRLLETIENILYGSDDNEARLPDAEELATIFTSMPPIAATNLMFNGSFEDSSGTDVTVRRNLIRYPTSAITGWVNLGDITKTSEGGQLKLVNNVAQNRMGVYIPTADVKPAGSYIVSFKAKAPSASITRVRAQLFDTVGVVTRAQEYKALVANGNSEYKYEFTFTTTGPFDRIYLEFANNNGSLNMNSTSVGYISEPIVEEAVIHRPYFNGDQVPKSRVNSATVPQPTVDKGWTSNNNTLYSRSFDAVGGRRTGTGAAALTRQPTGLNAVLAAVHAVGTQGWADPATFLIPVTPGDVWTVSGYATSTKSFKTRMVASFWDTAGVNTETPSGPFTSNTSAGNWARGVFTVTVPPGAYFMGVQQHVHTANDVNATGGERTKFCDVLIEKGSTLGAFFDGSYGAPTGFGRAWEGTAGLSGSYLYDLDLTVRWNDTVGASESDLFGTGIGIYPSPVASMRAIQSTRFRDGGTKSLRQIPVNSVEGSGYTDIATNTIPRGLVSGNTYTMVATFYLEYPQNAAIDDIYHRSMMLVGTVDIGYRAYTKAEDKTGKQILRMTFTIPPTGQWLLRLYNGGMMGGPSTWWDNIAIVDGEYTGPAFNGDTTDTDTHFFEWLGAPRQSESVMKTWYY